MIGGLSDAEIAGGALLGAALIAAVGSVFVAWLNRRTVRAVEGQLDTGSDTATLGQISRRLFEQGLLTGTQLGEITAQISMLRESVTEHHGLVGHPATLELILHLVELEHGPDARARAEAILAEIKVENGRREGRQ